MKKLNYSSINILYMILYYFIFEIQGQVPTANWDDYLEFFSSLRYCKNMVQEKENYKTCIYNLINQNELKWQGQDIFVKLCSNSHGYLNCWKPIVEKSRSCNAGTERGVPTIYKSSFEAMCGKDKGKSNKAKLERAMNQITTQQCSGSNEHWVDACSHLEEAMSSTNTCTRYRALSQCLNITVCKEQPVVKFFYDLYREAGKRLGC